jgi:hypothetical protein
MLPKGGDGGFRRARINSIVSEMNTLYNVVCIAIYIDIIIKLYDLCMTQIKKHLPA